jgi:hypothetical protein
MRIYVPATLDELDSAVVASVATRWTVTARRAHAVTAALASALRDEDEEGREYAAFLAAAHDSLELIAARAGVPPLRVVVSLDIPETAVALPGGGGFDGGAYDGHFSPSTVLVTRDVHDVSVVAVHVDEPEAAADIQAVLAAADEESDAESASDVGATSVLDDALQRVADRDLLWYDASEVHQIPRP